jgi:hypothetical protein
MTHFIFFVKQRSSTTYNKKKSVFTFWKFFLYSFCQNKIKRGKFSLFLSRLTFNVFFFIYFYLFEKTTR